MSDYPAKASMMRRDSRASGWQQLRPLADKSNGSNISGMVVRLKIYVIGKG